MLKRRLREVLSSSGAKDLEQPLEKLLSRLVEELRPIKVIVAGSLAKGRFVRGLSDVDVLVVVGYGVPRDKRFILASVKDVDVEVTVISEEELEEAVEEGREFFVDALRHGIVLFSAGPPEEP